MKTALILTRNKPENSSSTDAHRYRLKPSTSSRQSSKIEFTAHFAPDQHVPSLPSTVLKRNTLSWNKYWQEGGFVDFTSSSNPKAKELQRRIINSQYHVRVNSAANGQSPQESGLMNNGWYGKSTLTYSSADGADTRRKIPHGDGHMAQCTLVNLG